MLALDFRNPAKIYFQILFPLPKSDSQMIRLYPAGFS